MRIATLEWNFEARERSSTPILIAVPALRSRSRTSSESHFCQCRAGTPFHTEPARVVLPHTSGPLFSFCHSRLSLIPVSLQVRFDSTAIGDRCPHGAHSLSRNFVTVLPPFSSNFLGFPSHLPFLGLFSLSS